MINMTKVGIQLFTLRDELDKDFEGTLRKVAELGYQGVEFAGFYGRTSEQVAAILKETGLVAIGSHTPIQLLRDELDEVIEFNIAIGSKYIILPYIAEEDRHRWSEIAEDMKKIAQRCEQKGLVFLYHNHDFELLQHIEEQPVLDWLYEQIPARELKVELDTCWVHHAGYDPLAYIDRYNSRILLWHLKDMIKNEDGSPQTVELGQGEVDNKAIADAMLKVNVEWAIVEQDYCANDPIESVKTSMEWVKNYAKQGGNLDV